MKARALMVSRCELAVAEIVAAGSRIPEYYARLWAMSELIIPLVFSAENIFSRALRNSS
jgi:hypothetical protein